MLAALRRFPDAPAAGDLDAMLPWLRNTFGVASVDAPLVEKDRPPSLLEALGQWAS